MSEWIRLLDVADAPAEGTGSEWAAGGRVVALINSNGSFHAIDGMCAHQGGPLGQGTVAAGSISCPWHGWTYDLVTGCHRLNPAVRQDVFPVKVEDGAIWIELPDGDG